MSKMKNDVTEFTVENINNTAPVHKIVEELQQKNDPALAFYCHNIKQRPNIKRVLNYHCTVPGHPLHNFHEDWDGELNIEYFEPFPYKSLPPKMITPIKNIGLNDPLTDIINSKIEWNNTFYIFKKLASRRKLKMNFESLNEDVVRCPEVLVDIAAHIDSNEDRYFDSAYNWYYAGNGNLQYVCFNWVDYVLHSTLNCAYLTEFNKTDMVIKNEHSAVFETEQNNILESICSSLNIVVLRTKYKIYILKIVELNDNITFEKIIVTESEIPYTSISFDGYHTNILYITTLDSKLSIVNLDRIKARSVTLKGSKTLLNNWNSVIGCGKVNYTHVTKRSIFQYDKRSNAIINKWDNLTNCIDQTDCNDISVAKHLEESTLLYFGTDHHLFLLDLRYFTNHKPNIVQRWTHGMVSPPVFMSHSYMEFNKNLISLSSQWCEDLCVVPNYYENFKEPSSGGVTVPYRPPSILNALNEAQQKRLCIDLYHPIKDRLVTAISGKLVVEQEDRYNILMINSLGDISCHTLYPEHMVSFVDNDTAESLNDWCCNYKLDKKVFEVSSIENIASVLTKLKKVPTNYKVESNWTKTSNKYNEQEVIDAFEKEEIDIGLKYAWYKDLDDTGVDQSSLVHNFSDCDNESNDS